MNILPNYLGEQPVVPVENEFTGVMGNDLNSEEVSVPVQSEKVLIATQALHIASGWIGMHSTDGTDSDDGGEIDKIESLFGMHAQPWCAMFVCYCYAKAIMLLNKLETLEEGMSYLDHFIPSSASCETLMDEAKAKGLWMPVSQAAPGDMVLYCWNGSGNAEHVGLFSKHIDEYTIESVEGNTVVNAEADSSDSHGVYIRNRSNHLVLGVIHL